jgi:intergrase/recombinase
MDRSGFEPEASCLRSLYSLPPASKYNRELKKWMDQKGFSQGYKSDIQRYLKPIENKEIHVLSELREIASNSSSSMVLTVIRAYINFLLDNEIISEETAIYFRKALPSRKTNPDGYVPTDNDIKRAYQGIENERDRLLFQVLAFSGIRVTELVKMLMEFNKSKLITDDKISKYPLNYNRGNKRSQYVYMPTELAMKLHRFYIHKDTVSSNIRKYGVAPKYLRKWFYNFLIINNVPESVADFIEGRAPESVGSMHYLSRVKQADYWYKKGISKLDSVLNC